MEKLNFSRQLKSLYTQSNDLLKEDGIIKNGMFYQRLEEFIKFYNETKRQLKEYHQSNNDMVMTKIASLPEIDFKNYDNTLSMQSFLYTIFYIIFFPIGVIYLFKKYNYVSNIKSRLREISGSLSSIEFLTRNE